MAFKFGPRGGFVILGRARNEKGQLTMEMILLMSVLASISLLVMRTARDQKFAGKFVEGPWMPVKGMIENGVWQGNMRLAKAYHPSMKNRHATAEGNPIPER